MVFLLTLTLLHSERPKLYAILAFLSAVGLILGHFNQFLKSKQADLMGQSVIINYAPRCSGG